MKTERCSLTGIIAFLAVLATIIVLSKVGGTGADLAIMTALIGVLGMIAPGLVPSRGNETQKPQPVTVTNPPSDPVNTTETQP